MPLKLCPHLFFFPTRRFRYPFAVPLTLQLDWSLAESFLDTVTPGVEGVQSQGKYILIKIREDANSFFTSSTIGVLLWAVCSGAIRAVFDRFDNAIHSCGRVAYLDLLEEKKVTVSTRPPSYLSMYYRRNCLQLFRDAARCRPSTTPPIYPIQIAAASIVLPPNGQEGFRQCCVKWTDYIVFLVFLIE